MTKKRMDARKHSVAMTTAEDNSETVVDNNSLSPPVASPAQPAPSQQNSCWNCGRKAHETCSGCSMARYCSPFCQHKDWENHHQVCSKDKSRPMRTSTPSATAAAAAPPTSAATQHHNMVVQSDPVKFKK